MYAVPPFGFIVTVGFVMSYFIVNASDTSETFPALSIVLKYLVSFLFDNPHSSVPVAFRPFSFIPLLAVKPNVVQFNLSAEY